MIYVVMGEKGSQAVVPPCKVLVGVADLGGFGESGLVSYLKATKKMRQSIW